MSGEMMNVIFCNDELWLICGGRDFADQKMFDDAMADLIGAFGYPSSIVHGGCPTGADAMADGLAGRLSIGCIRFPAEWNVHGRSAGPIRNSMMLGMVPHKVIAFPGGRGTADMTRKAMAKGVTVIEIRPHDLSNHTGGRDGKVS